MRPDERPWSPEQLAELVPQAHLERLQWQQRLREPWPRGQRPQLLPFALRLEPTARKRSFDQLVPHAELPRALRGHVARLIWDRLSQPFSLAWAEAWQKPQPRLSRREAQLGSAEQLLRALLCAPAELGSELLDALAQLHGALAAAELQRHEARAEIAARLGLTSPLDAALPLPEAQLQASAAHFLNESEDLLRELWRARRRAQPGFSLAHLLCAARGAAGVVKMTNLSTRWLRAALPQFATARLDPQSGQPFARALLSPPLLALGESSYGRALSRLGQALVLCAPLSASEWVQRIDGALCAPLRIGLLFAALNVSPVFLARVHGGAQLERERAQRSAALAALLRARACAAVVLAPHARSAQNDEMAQRVFGEPLPRGLFGVLPRRDLDDAAPRWLAWLDHPVLQQSALGLFDEDWFRNPRSRSWAMLPPPLGLSEARDLELAARRLARHFEALCG